MCTENQQAISMTQRSIQCAKVMLCIWWVLKDVIHYESKYHGSCLQTPFNCFLTGHNFHQDNAQPHVVVPDKNYSHLKELWMASFILYAMYPRLYPIWEQFISINVEWKTYLIFFLYKTLVQRTNEWTFFELLKNSYVFYMQTFPSLMLDITSKRNVEQLCCLASQSCEKLKENEIEIIPRVMLVIENLCWKWILFFFVFFFCF